MTKTTFIQSFKKIPRAYWFFGIFCFLFTALMVFVEIKNGKFWTNDFKVYYNAARDFFLLGNDPYDHAYGLRSGLFKYPPTSLYFFFPVSIFGYFTAQMIHTVQLVLSFICSVAILHNLFFYRSKENANKKRIGLLYLAFVFVVIHLVREFHMGNINLFLLFLFVAGIFAYDKSKFYTQAIFWSIMVILKPIVILAFIPLLFYKQWKTILIMAGIGLLFLILPMLHMGIAGTIELWGNWLNALIRHGDYITSENSLTYLSNFYIGIKSAWIPSIIILLLLVFIMIIDLKNQMNPKDKFIDWSIIFMAFTPNFFVTDTEHFLLTLPLILLLIKILIDKKKFLYWIIFVFIVISFSLNSKDLLGNSLSNYMIEYGVLGISNLLFIIFYLFLTILKPSKKTVEIV